MTKRGATGTLTISAVSNLLDIPVPTIRSWERRYGFPEPARTSGAHRRYEPRSIEALRALRDEIASGVRAEVAVAALRSNLRRGEKGVAYVRSLLEAGLDYDAPAIRAVLDKAAKQLGLDETVQWVVLPVLREVGTLWEAGKCDVAQEHVASQEIRAWLANRVGVSASRRARSLVLLACGPKDLHTIGLEAFYVILTKRGIRCRLLGAQIPAAALYDAAVALSPSAVVVTSHLGSHRRAAVESMRGLEGLDLEIFYAGNAFGAAKSRRGVPGTYLGRELTAAADMIEEHI